MIRSQWPERTLRAVRGSAAALSASEIARSAGLPLGSMLDRLHELARYGVVTCCSPKTHPTLWALGPADHEAAIARMRQESKQPQSETRKSAMSRAKQSAQAKVAGRLRDLMLVGSNAISGDPLRELADAMDAARAVMAARYEPGCRFGGAEVDIMVARELRQISEAARRATLNLREALGVLTG